MKWVKCIIAGIVIILALSMGALIYAKIDIPFLGHFSDGANERRIAEMEDVVGRLEDERAAARNELELNRSRIDAYAASLERAEERQRADAGRIKRLEENVDRSNQRARDLEEAIARAEGSVGSAREAAVGIGEIAAELEKEFERLEGADGN